MRYSILTYIIGDYEKVLEIEEKDPEAEYILVTNNSGLKSNTWNIVQDTTLNGLPPFDAVCAIRYNVFKYCHTDICIRIDGSIKIKHSLKLLIDIFEEGQYDACLMPHPVHDNFLDEYDAWVKIRNYSRKQADRCIEDMRSKGYDFNYRGMFQGCFSIQRKGELTAKIDNLTYNYIKELGTDGVIERIDQIPFSFIMNTQFSDIRVLPVSEQILRSYYMQWCEHGSNRSVIPPMESLKGSYHSYMFDKEAESLCLYAPPVPDAIAKREKTLMLSLYENYYSMVTRNKKHLKLMRLFAWLSAILFIGLLISVVYNIM